MRMWRNSCVNSKHAGARGVRCAHAPTRARVRAVVSVLTSRGLNRARVSNTDPLQLSVVFREELASCWLWVVSWVVDFVCRAWVVGFSGCCLCVCMVVVGVTIHSAFRSALYPAHLDASHAGFVRRVEREESVVAGQYRAAADTRTAGVDTRHRGALQFC